MPLTESQRAELVRLCDAHQAVTPRPYTFEAEQALTATCRAAVLEAHTAILKFLASEGITLAAFGTDDIPGITAIASISAEMLANPSKFAGDGSVAADALRAAGLAPASLELNARQRFDLTLLCDAHDAAKAGDYLAYVTATAALVGYVAAERLGPEFFAGDAGMRDLTPAYAAAAQMVACAKSAQFAAAFAQGRFGYDVMTAAGFRLTA